LIIDGFREGREKVLQIRNGVVAGNHNADNIDTLF